MNIIFLSNFCNRKRSFDLCFTHLTALVVGFVLVFGGGVFWIGYQVALNYGVEIETVDAANEMREMMSEERTLLHEARDENRLHLDALALRIADLRAHVMRLNALGERLVNIGKLDAGEFDFQAEPGLGGVAALDDGEAQSLDELINDMDQISGLLEDREHKLDLLEAMLLDNQLENEVLPSGRPVKKGWVSSSFGRRTDPFSGKKRYHRGIDFAGKPGTDVVAVASGVVIRSEKVPDYGNIVEIRHTDGFSTRYAHNQENLVEAGEVVEKGEVIALLGSTGRSNGPHVHFEVHRDGKIVNPRKYVYKR
jgi:murein DD-endopeptidase MepM/ murein hydrolase activator NlpD